MVISTATNVGKQLIDVTSYFRFFWKTTLFQETDLDNWASSNRQQRCDKVSGA